MNQSVLDRSLGGLRLARGVLGCSQGNPELDGKGGEDSQAREKESLDGISRNCTGSSQGDQRSRRKVI